MRARWWLWAALGLFVLSILMAGYFYLRAPGETAVISQNGEILYKIDLTAVKEPYTIDIGGAYHNVIEVEPGRIRVSEAGCPDKICVNTGWIPDGGRPIVCLPNELVIEIEGEDSGIDAASK